MGACQVVSKWIIENILTPVQRFITETREACRQIDQWVEEQISQPIEDWISQTERRCAEQSCNWWCICCNKWFCWFVTVVVRVITWIVVTVGRWVATIVCDVVTWVVGIVVELVLKVLHRLVTFFVCLFTHPLQALKTIWDLWNDLLDTVGDVFDFVTTLLDDVIGILEDVTGLLGGLGRSLCIFGEGMCAIGGAIFGVISGVVRWAADVVDWVRDTITGVRDLVTGLFTGNWCRIQGGLRILNVLRVITSITRIPASWFYIGPAALINQARIQSIIDLTLSEAFGSNEERLERARRRAHMGGSPVGLPLRILPSRLAIRSGTFLHGLVREGVINIHALAGRLSDCSGKFIFDQFAGEVVYTGTATAVSQSDLDTFISDGPDAVASFTVYPISTDLFRRYLEVARRKGFQLGINFTWGAIREIVIDDGLFVPLQSSESDDSAQKNLRIISPKVPAPARLPRLMASG